MAPPLARQRQSNEPQKNSSGALSPSIQPTVDQELLEDAFRLFDHEKQKVIRSQYVPNFLTALGLTIPAKEVDEAALFWSFLFSLRILRPDRYRIIYRYILILKSQNPRICVLVLPVVCTSTASISRIFIIDSVSLYESEYVGLKRQINHGQPLRQWAL